MADDAGRTLRFVPDAPRVAPDDDTVRTMAVVRAKAWNQEAPAYVALVERLIAREPAATAGADGAPAADAPSTADPPAATWRDDTP